MCVCVCERVVCVLCVCVWEAGEKQGLCSILEAIGGLAECACNRIDGVDLGRAWAWEAGEKEGLCSILKAIGGLAECACNRIDGVDLGLGAELYGRCSRPKATGIKSMACAGC